MKEKKKKVMQRWKKQKKTMTERHSLAVNVVVNVVAVDVVVDIVDAADAVVEIVVVVVD